MPQPSAEKEKQKSWWDKFVDGVGSFFSQVVLGDFSGEVTIQRTVGEVAVGFVPVAGTIADVRDFVYDAFHWEWSWEHAGRMGIDTSLLSRWGIFSKKPGTQQRESEMQ